MFNNSEELINDLFAAVSEIEQIKEYKYGKEFLREWKKLLMKHSKNSKGFQSEFKENNQIFHYEFSFMGINLSFEYDIKYLLDLLEKDLVSGNKLFPKVILTNDNGTLKYADEICTYTLCEKTEIKNFYDDLNKILITKIPILTGVLVVIDGNHRVSKLINENAKYIDAYYVIEAPAEASIIDLFDACLYCFLFDVNKIIYNSGKVADGWLRNKLNIFNRELAFNIILNRKRINDIVV